MNSIVIKRAVALLAILFGFGSVSCSTSPVSYSGQVESITIGMEPTAVNSLIYIAEQQDFFAANGLSVTTREYESGLAAVNGMIAREVDVATAAEFVVVGKAFARERVHTFGSIDRFLHNYILGRTDRGIGDHRDLRGKRIAVPLKTAAEFYLGRFLDLHGMDIRQVTLVDASPSAAVELIANGQVDAVIAWQPYVKAIEERLGDRLVKWPAQSEQVTYCSIVSSDSWIAGNPDTVRRLLASLAEAEAYNASHPGEARAIVQKRLRYDDAYIASVWPEHQFSLSLDQSLILAMEDEARWMANNNLTAEKTTPDFLNYIYAGGLDAVKPKSVNIIR